MKLTDELKNQIDNMNYEDMLRKVRFAPLGDPLFAGESGDYFGERYRMLRLQVGSSGHSAASKEIGWGD